MTTHTVITLILVAVVVVQQTRIVALKRQNNRLRRINCSLSHRLKAMWEKFQGWSEPKSRFF